MLHYSSLEKDLNPDTIDYGDYRAVESVFGGTAPQLERNVWHLRNRVSRTLLQAGTQPGFWTHVRLHKHLPLLPLDDPSNEQLPGLLLKHDKDGTTWVRFNGQYEEDSDEEDEEQETEEEGEYGEASEGRRIVEEEASTDGQSSSDGGSIE